MTGMTFLSALLLGAAAPASTGAPDEAALRNARNWDVMLSQYPPRARRAGEQGPVGFRVTLDHEGYASACEVTRSSGYPRLDNETCRLIMTRGAFKGISDSNGRKVNAVYEGVVNWRLPEGTRAAAPPVRTASADTPERIICRRQPKAGSLNEFERTCMTRADWRRFTDAQREFWQELQGSKGSTGN
jgi:TonB family protein